MSETLVQRTVALSRGFALATVTADRPVDPSVSSHGVTLSLDVRPGCWYRPMGLPIPSSHVAHLRFRRIAALCLEVFPSIPAHGRVEVPERSIHRVASPSEYDRRGRSRMIVWHAARRLS